MDVGNYAYIYIIMRNVRMLIINHVYTIIMRDVWVFMIMDECECTG